MIEWGTHRANSSAPRLESEALIRQKCLGAILNKVDVKKARKYLPYDSHFADYSQYLKTGG